MRCEETLLAQLTIQWWQRNIRLRTRITNKE
jgi:hypothetical protein